ncbi:MAG: MFS transporter [Planctomycetaceae bacterium]
MMSVLESGLPKLSRDRSFLGMVATQFLGAFNDNIFKQMVVLVLTDYAMRSGTESETYQPYAHAAFALPFVLFSGMAGWLSDRVSKRGVVVVAKLAEIVVMLAGMLVLFLCDLGSKELFVGLLAVLTLMSLQSAFFGPAKYGILPEMLREEDLPPANGVIQLTTFVAIILGVAVCGALKGGLEARWGLWPVSGVCVGLAVVGTLTSLLLRPTPPAHPGLKLKASNLLLDRETWRLLRSDRTLARVLLAVILFWFLGGVSLQIVTEFGKQQLQVGDWKTSILNAALSLGIGVGCVISGALSKHTIRFGLVRCGAWGMVVTFSVLASLALWQMSTDGLFYVSAILFVLMGGAAGLYAVPLQVFLQARPSADQKGRMIGTMNLTTWIGVLASAGFYNFCASIIGTKSISLTFLPLALLILPVAIFYRPKDEFLRPTLSVESSGGKTAVDS